MEAKNVKKPSRTLIQVMQAIENLTRQNTKGQYNERLKELETEKLETEAWIKENTTTIRTKYIPSPEEVKAIQLFNKDKRFTITE